MLSLEATSSKLRQGNTFEPIPKYKKLNLLKSAVIYGANASGKSNIIQLMWTLRKFVLNSSELKAGDPIPSWYYDPFLLDTSSENAPTEITINSFPITKKGIGTLFDTTRRKYSTNIWEFMKQIGYQKSLSGQTLMNMLSSAFQ
jgi:AAA15 family ATPase/GTPase